MTKRQLGLALIALALWASVGILAVDVLDAGQFQGIGPAQQSALAIAGGVLLLGVSLLPLGERPA